jgi:hypothetical protein
MEAYAPKDADAEARQILDLLQSGKTDVLQTRLDIHLRNKDAKIQLQQLAVTLPKEQPKNIDLVEFRSGSGSTDRFYVMTYQMEYTTEWILARVSLSKKANQWLVSGLNIEYTPHSALVSLDFTLTDKTVLHYVFFTLSVIVPCFVLATLVVCYKTKVDGRKWLWYFAILICFANFKLNWSTGEVAIQPLSISLFGASFSRSGLLAPWVIGFGLPLGAIVFILKRRTLSGNSDA